jgi:hypothetical protein
MPAAKKAGSARRAPATNKDGSARKKPGPAKGTPRGVKAAPATTPAAKAPAKRRGTRTKKTFLIYSVEGNELSFATEHPGATGQIAVASAVKEGILAPDTPYVFLTPATVARAVEIEAVERDVQYKVKAATKKRATRKPKALPATAPPTPADPPVETAEEKPASARGGKKAALPPSPPATTANPFA